MKKKLLPESKETNEPYIKRCTVLTEYCKEPTKVYILLKRRKKIKKKSW